MAENIITPAPVPPAPLLVSEAEAGRLLGVSARTVFALAKSGALPVVRIGGRKLFPLAGLERFIVQRQTGGRA